MISSSSVVKESGVVYIGISDHCMVYCILKLRVTKPPPTYIYVRSFKHYDPSLFVTDLSFLLFNEIFSMDDVDGKLDLFNQLFICTLNYHAPIKFIKVKGRSQPFIDKAIKLLMKSRDDALRIFKSTHNLEDWNKYKSLRNSVKTMLRKAEVNHVRTQIENDKGNLKSIWKVINRCMPNKETTKPCYKKDHSKIAEEFNTYFTSVGKSTADKVKKLAEENGVSITHSMPIIINDQIASEEMFEFRAVTPYEVRRIILESPSNKAPGPDKIGIRSVKDSLDIILLPLTDIINCSLKTSKYPLIWKLAEVIPLLKEGDHEVA